MLGGDLSMMIMTTIPLLFLLLLHEMGSNRVAALLSIPRVHRQHNAVQQLIVTWWDLCCYVACMKGLL